ncbi:hypothetical protein HU200_022110 [Digitaria exilis]|uniref:Trichome birefringence-like C-terminal domain-containing protein n=1 Tax=Digitaria exilis TaxID=1010633 RepID=A0A835CDE3_9POAL|nr:hypothetical protein HU200_022110 [Digitaria exilis]
MAVLLWVGSPTQWVDPDHSHPYRGLHLRRRPTGSPVPPSSTTLLTAASLAATTASSPASYVDLTLRYSQRMAFRTALRALLTAGDGEFDGTTVVVRTVSPTSHFEGSEWDKGGDCRRTRPYAANETTMAGLDLGFHTHGAGGGVRRGEGGGRGGEGEADADGHDGGDAAPAGWAPEQCADPACHCRQADNYTHTSSAISPLPSAHLVLGMKRETYPDLVPNSSLVVGGWELKQVKEVNRPNKPGELSTWRGNMRIESKARSGTSKE